MTGPVARGKRRAARTKRLAFAVVLLGVLYAVLEGAALGVFALRHGGFSLRRLHAEQQQLGGELSVPIDATDPADPLVADRRLHPYLGYTLDPDDNLPTHTAELGMPVSGDGFRDDQGLVRRRQTGRVIVAILGGSVAEMLSRLGAQTLEAELRKHPRFAENRLEIVRLGLGGYKQPQQLLGLTYLWARGGEIDFAINLDGFNEVALPATAAGEVPADHPQYWDRLTRAAGDPQWLAALGKAMHLSAARCRLARAMTAGPWRWSVVCNLLWKTGDDQLRRALAGAREAAHESRRGGHRGSGVDVQFADLVELWKRCSIQIDSVCRSRGVGYYHFLQPNQYVPHAKPLTDDERRNAYRADSPYRPPVELGYPLLRAAGQELRRSGVRYFDLSDLFASQDLTLFIDSCCHLNQAGNDLLAAAIARAIVDDLGPAEPPPPVHALRSEASHYLLTHPLEQRSLRIVGRSAAAGERDVTNAGLAFSSSDSAVVRVDRHGELEALRPGTATIHAALGDLAIDIPVEVRFPPIARLGSGHSAHGDEQLTLEVQAHGDSLTFCVDGVRRARDALLCVAHAPTHDAMCGGIAFVAPTTAQTAPLRLQPGRNTLSFPAPWEIFAETLFAQVFVREANHRCGWSMTNGVAIAGR